ncbi:MAG: flagellar hook protein FlgE [Planctomycetota bacterium]
MGNALNAGVSGLKAHQSMMDVAGNNLSNVNTTAFKSSRASFSELLSQTIRQASAPGDGMGGMNPVQSGNGVEVSSIDRDMNQGALVNTGQALDMAIEGAGFFVMDGSSGEAYSRAGTFSVDADYTLVDPSTGYRLQRIDSTGESDGFQRPGDTSIRIPYDVALPAAPTTQITCVGNLQADADAPTTHKMRAGTDYAFTVDGSTTDASATLESLDNTTITGAGTMTLAGRDKDGNDFTDTLAVDTTTTGQDLLDFIENAFSAEGTDIDAFLSNGEIIVEADDAGYNQMDLDLSYSGAAGDSFELPPYWQIEVAGGEAKKDVNVEVFDTLGISHAITGSFVKTNTNNQWDFVATSVTGDIETFGFDDRRVKGINFGRDGTYMGIDSTIGDSPEINVTFANIGNVSSFAVDCGDIGKTNGLTQFGSASTASVIKQDGYASGSLSSMSISRDGVITGLFSNGVRRDIATVKMATFQNPAGLESIGNNYYQATGNSGDAKTSNAMTGGAGAIRGSALEKSNVDVAKEFVTLIQAQNGYQANARTIRVANDMLKELTNLIR